jgi:hypothetical protein
MTSAIVSSSIDEAYPVAGVDNNSQGFRDNFTAIKAGLATAAGEITVLQNESAKITQDNDFDNNAITNAVYNKFYGVAFRINDISVSQVPISLNNGPLQYLTITGATTVTLSLQDWPDINQYAKIRLHIFSNQSNTKTINFGTVNAGVIKPESTFPTPFTLLPNGTSKVVELWSYNGGNTVFMRYLGSY